MALSSKSAFQRHKHWLQHAKTRSARHKIMKFLREQAALSAADITKEVVNNFIVVNLKICQTVQRVSNLCGRKYL
ncbi:hypothetical protein L6164_010252 [Bauhinia variegata]|uniref:Uncharacterized protein n=1 Tax=Bauhinia variegata TaxID=167791 RepID=A0ACB9PLN4_BAUVA|nr:hypothetical protein L6164_010252 [Bauhinia variegata]